jgi:tRNA(fMet)-specific endonuclease VapC
LLDGIYRDNILGADEEFLTQILPAYEVVYLNERIIALGAKINAELSKGQTIGMADTLIAATAIIHQWPLVNANAKHFQQVVDKGFSLTLENWRDAP